MAETTKKTKTATTAAKPRKTTKKTAEPMVTNNVTSINGSLSHDEVARLAHRYYQERGQKHGHHVEDWVRAEHELRGKAS